MDSHTDFHGQEDLLMLSNFIAKHVHLDKESISSEGLKIDMALLLWTAGSIAV